MHLQANKLFDLKCCLVPSTSCGAKVTHNITQYPLHHVTYTPAKFEVVMSNSLGDAITKLEDMTALKCSPDLLNNVKKRSRSTTAYNEKYFVLWGLPPFWSNDLKQSYEYSIKQSSDF